MACSGGDDRPQGISISSGGAEGTEGTSTASSTPTEEPTPTPLPVPARPQDPFSGGQSVAQYLAEGDPNIEGCLPELVDAWRMAPSVAGERCMQVDLDGDRRDELVFLVSFASGAEDASPFPSDVWFFDDAEEDYRFLDSTRALANAETTALQIRSVEDLTSDGVPEVMMTWEECGASTCITHVSIASHHNGLLEDLAPPDAAVESLQGFSMDAGVITMQAGLAGSVGAGPQRESTTTVRWAGSLFRAEVTQGPPVYLVHLVNDADALFNNGLYAEAEQAYLDAAANGTLPDWKAEIGEAPGRPELEAYSTFRAAISAFRQSDLIGAGRLLERAATQYPETMHGSAAVEYLIALQDGDTPEEACSAAEVFLGTFAAQYAAFWNYGTENPERTVADLCR